MTDDSSALLPSSFASVGGSSSQIVLSVDEFRAQLSALPDDEASPLLIFDQFEELVTLFEEAPAEDALEDARKAQGRIVEMLSGILRDETLRAKLLFGFREDYLAKVKKLLDLHPELVSQSMRLSPPGTDVLPRIIRGPFEEHPGHFERELSEDLTKRLTKAIERRSPSGTISLSEVQIVCLRLWESPNPDELLRERHVRGILEDYLKESVERFPEELHYPAIALLSQMVTGSGARNVISADNLVERVRDEEQDITEGRLKRTLDALEKKTKLVRRERRRDLDLYEISSEFLVPWIARQRQERVEARERERARKKQRRLFGALVVGAVLLAAMAGITVYALAQRDEAQNQAQRAQASQLEALRLAGLARAQKARALASKKKAESETARAERAEKVAKAKALQLQKETEKAQQSEAQAQQSEAQAQQSEAQSQQSAAQAQQSAAQAQQSAAQAQQSEAKANAQEAAALEAKAEAEQAANRATARALAEEALTLLPQRPVESLRLALRAAEREPTPLAERVLRTALTGSRLRAVLPGGGGRVADASFSRDGRRIVTVADRARVFDARTGALVRALPDPARVNAASFSPDDSRVLTATLDGSARLWPVGGGGPILLTGHSKSVEDAVFSLDGSMIATASFDRTARVWNAETGEQLSVLQHDGPVFAVEFSPDGKLVVTVSRVARTGRHVARLFDAVSGKPIRTFEQIGITTAIFSPEGAFIATTSTDNTTRIWDPHAPGAIAVLEQPDGNVISASFSADGTKLATASEGSSVMVWRVATWQRDFTIVGLLNPATDASFSPNGRFIVVSSRDRTAQIFNGDNGLRLAILPGHTDGVSAASFGPGGRTVVTASEDGSARIWDPGIGDLLQLVGKPNEGAIRRASLSPNGRLAVSAGADGTARVLDVAKRRQLDILRHDGPVNDARFSPAGTLIITASDDGKARVWRVNGELLRVLPHEGPVLRAIFSPDGRLIATASNDVVRIWRARDGRLLHTLEGHKGVVLDVAFSPDGKRIASGGDSSDRTARIWGVDGTALHVFRHRGPVVRVTFSPDGTVLATASGDEMARLWRVDSGRLQKTLRGHTDFVRDVEFRRDGKVVVTASDDGDARTWSVATGELLEVFRGHFSSVQAASFSPNGHWIVTAGPRTAGLWDARTGQFFPPTGLVADPFLRGPARGPVTTAEFTPDGQRIVTASGDGTVRTYFCTACGPIQALLQLARSRLAALERELTPAERRLYLQG
jgi:WD40 repeat protein